MQDSNGKELTPEQAEFFKDSKVVDEDGNLLVVYHGTNAEFTVFDKSKYNSNENEGDYVGEGFFFSKNSSTANKYGKNIVSAYINIENPLIIDTEKDAKDFGQTFLRMYKNGDSDLRKLLGGMYDYFEIANENPALIRGELIRRGYDGLIDNLYNQYAVFDSNQIKSTDNLNPTDSEDIRYSYRESFGKGDEYLYENLIKKPPINIVKLTTNAPITENGKINRKKLVDTAIENVIAFGKLNKNGNAVINNYDTGNDIIVSKKSLQHGLDRRVEPQAQVLSHIGEVLQYSIVVNELSPKNDSIDNTYILLGMARSKDKELYIISSLVNSYTNEAEAVDVLYSVNTKKESAALLPELQSNDLQSPTDSKISISSFLEIVNEYFPDVLPTDVLKHFGHDKRPSSKIGESALYSYREFKGTPEQASREQLEKTLAVLEEQFKLTHGERIDRKALRGFIKDLTKRYPLLSTFFDLHLTCTLTCLYVFLYAFICAVKKSKNPETLYRKHYQEFSPAKTKGVVWCG